MILICKITLSASKQAISSILVPNSPFFTTIPSHALPLPFIMSIQLNYSSSSKATNSTSKTSHKTFHKLFHVNISPLVQLKVWFFAPSVTAAHTCCSASTLASDMSLKCSDVYLFPEYRNDNPWHQQIVAWIDKVSNMLYRPL